MAGWGAGFGSFATGLTSGYKLGEGIQIGQQTRQLNDQRIQAGQMELDQKRQAVDAKKQFDALGITGKQQFDAAVKAGTADPENPEDFWTQTMAPKYQQYYLEHGDPAKAAAFKTWAQDAKTKRTMTSMGQLLGKFHDTAETGNYDALGDSLGKFYNGLDPKLRDGSVFSGLDVSKDEAGNVTGVNVVFLDKNDQPVQHSFKDIGSFQSAMQSWATPSALFEQTLKSQSDAQKLKTELGKHRGEKTIDADIDVQKKLTERGLGLSGKAPAERYNETEKVLAEGNSKWLQLSPDEKHAAVLDRLRRIDDYERSVSPGIAGGGRAAAPPKPQQIIFDTKTGKPVVVPAGAPPAAAGQPAAPGAQPAAPATPSSITAPAPGSAPAAAPAAGTSPAAPPPQTVAPGLGYGDGGAYYDPSQDPAAQAPAASPAAVASVRPAASRPAPASAPVTRGSRFDQEAMDAPDGAGARAGDAVREAGESMGKTITQMPEVRAVKKVGEEVIRAAPQIGAKVVDGVKSGAKAAKDLFIRKEPGYQADAEGMIKAGNIDTSNRPVVKNPDGSVSTVRSISIGVGDKTVLIPTVVNGRVVSNDDAIRHFRQTGQHLGVFKDVKSADAYAEALHEQQASALPKSRPQQSRSAPGLGLGG